MWHRPATVRVLLLTTPWDERSRLDGSRRAAADLVTGFRALVEGGSEGVSIDPLVLARRGWLQSGHRERAAGHVDYLPIVSPRACGVCSSAEIVVRLAAAKVDVVHAMLTPRVSTLTVLRWLQRMGRRVLVTITSWPEVVDEALVRALKGFSLIVGSEASRARMDQVGLSATFVPIPFEPPREVVPIRWPCPYFLYAGDFGDDGLAWSMQAIEALKSGVPSCDLIVAARTKRRRDVFRRVGQQWLSNERERRRVHVLGEVEDLLPWIAAAKAVLLPTPRTRAKLDHPRVLLEALSLRVPIVVGPAPALSELLTPSLGHQVGSQAELTAVLAHLASKARSADPVDDAIIEELLAVRTPEHVAKCYGDLYASIR